MEGEKLSGSNLAIVLVYVAIALLSLIFVLSSLGFSAKKTPWGDEEYGMAAGVRGTSVGEIFLEGVPGQGSPAPLDYLLLKGWDYLGDHFRFGLPPFSFYRLNSLMIIVLTGVGLTLNLVARVRRMNHFSPRVKLVPLGLCVLFLGSFLFSTQIFYYSAEARPYALWTALFLILVFFVLFEAPRFGIAAVGVLL